MEQQQTQTARRFLLNLARRIERRSRRVATKRPDVALRMIDRAERLTAAAIGGVDVGVAWLGLEVRT